MLSQNIGKTATPTKIKINENQNGKNKSDNRIKPEKQILFTIIIFYTLANKTQRRPKLVNIFYTKRSESQ